MLNIEAATDYAVRKKRREERRAKLIALIGDRCVHCGSKDNLQFDHKNKKDKSFDISHSIDTKEERLIKEVKKCQLLCKNCHTKKNSDAWDYAKPPSNHGTIHHYKNHKCRCDKCKNAASKYYYSKLKSVAQIFFRLYV